MKLFIVLSLVALSSAAKLNKNYLPPSGAQSSGGSGNILRTPVEGQGFNQGPDAGGQFGGDANGAIGGGTFEEQKPERPQAAQERSAATLRSENTNDGETFAYAYETDNGITADENGVASNGVEAQGGYSYTGDDGQVYSVRYTAGVNGFVPQGNHIPTPPPVPEEIQKALEIIANAQANGATDDGQYNAEKYNAPYSYNAPSTAPQNLGPQESDDTIVTNAASFRNPSNQYIPQAKEAPTTPAQPSGFQGRAQNGYPARRQSFDSQNGYQY